jgi:ketosteroid isomerase-like protein
VHGLSQILRSWAAVLARMTYLQFFLTDVRGVMIGGVAIVTCVENVLSNLPGEESASVGFGGSHYEAVNVFRQDKAGSWRLIAHSSAPVFPSSEGDSEPE